LFRDHKAIGKCIEFFRTFLDDHPYSKVSWFNLGVAYGNMEEFDKSVEAYDFAIAIDESFSSAYFNKANCYANAGMYEKAIQTYLETLFYEDPEPSDLLLHR